MRCSTVTTRVISRGNVAFDLDFDAKLGSGLESLNSKYRISLTEGEAAYGDFFAAAGIRSELGGKIAAEPSGFSPATVSFSSKAEA